MIKSLSNISDISVIDQNGRNDILSFSEIEFDHNILGSGGFGSVHNVHSIDGVSKTEYVLKLFTDEEHKQHAYDVIQILHFKLKKRQRKTKTPIYHDIPELLGLPFLVFKGYDNISGQYCVAFLMFNLEKLNYEDYGNDTSKLEEYKLLSLPDKLYLAYQLTKTIDFLHQINFIHADLSENSLWFNPKRIQLAIIDFDSGYHFDSQQKPTTVGKIGHWIGSRFRNIIGQEKDSSNLTTIDRLYEEYWVLANATFEVVFGVMPFFFLSDTDSKTKESYFADNEWPNINYTSSLFNKANISQHQVLLKFIEQLEKAGVDDLIRAFREVFNKGYKNESKRLTSKEWKNLLLKLIQSIENKPIIKSFNSNKSSIKRKNDNVQFAINVQKYNSIYLNNELVPLNQKTIVLKLEDEAKIVLKSINDFQSVEDFIEIEALKVEPKIISFEASTSFRDSETPVILNWLVENAKEILISGLNDSFKSKGSTNVEPIDKTTYILTAIGFFDERITKEIVVDVVSPKIKSFTWEINLNEGIDNIDLKWITEETQAVEISPHVKNNSSNGIAHVPISDETTFKLTAIGMFNKVEMEVTAHPFPVPIIKQIFTESPKIEINARLDFTESKVHSDLFTVDNIQFSNNVHFNDLEINTEELISSIKFPEFENKNVLIEKFSKQKISLNDIYEIVLDKIHKRLIR